MRIPRIRGEKSTYILINILNFIANQKYLLAAQPMQITINIPDNIYSKISSEAEDIPQTCKEMLAKRYYHNRTISLTEAIELSCLPIYEFIPSKDKRRLSRIGGVRTDSNWIERAAALCNAKENQLYQKDGYTNFKKWVEEVKKINPRHAHEIIHVYNEFKDSPDIINVIPFNRLQVFSKLPCDVVAHFKKTSMLKVGDKVYSVRELAKTKRREVREIYYDYRRKSRKGVLSPENAEERRQIILRSVLAKKLKQKEAASLLNVSGRHIKRLVKKLISAKQSMSPFLMF